MGGTGTGRIGVMGGTFDPIHIGHLVIAEEARVQFRLDKVLFMPSGNPPHKEEGESLDAEERFQMAVIATAGNTSFEVLRLEIERPGPSYTIDTLRELHGIYGGEAEIFFITGADAILEILTWKEPERVLRECIFIAATRPGFDLGELLEALPEKERKRQFTDPHILLMEIPALDISSTDIRRRIEEHRSIRYLIPDGVWDFIEKNGFYR
jgi:nicotinate-nucleotide adenylyltransferase